MVSLLHITDMLCLYEPISKSSSSGLFAGSVNLLHWKCMIPGKTGTPWDKGVYPLELIFSENYPSKPPECRFPKAFFHPNGDNLLAFQGKTDGVANKTFKCHCVCSLSIWIGVPIHCISRKKLEACHYCQAGDLLLHLICYQMFSKCHAD